MTDKTIALVLIAFMVMSSFASATHLGKANKDSSKSFDKAEYDEVKALMEENDKLDEEPRLDIEDREDTKDPFDFSVFKPKYNEDKKTEVGGSDSLGATQ